MYKFANNGVIRLSDGAFIPDDAKNRDYSEFLAWSENNSPYPKDTDPTPVYRCDPWQIRKAITNLGIRQQVELAVESSDDIRVKDGWAHAPVFSSADPFVLSIGLAVGKTAEETAQVIQYASGL